MRILVTSSTLNPFLVALRDDCNSDDLIGEIAKRALVDTSCVALYFGFKNAEGDRVDYRVFPGTSLAGTEDLASCHAIIANAEHVERLAWSSGEGGSKRSATRNIAGQASPKRVRTTEPETMVAGLDSGGSTVATEKKLEVPMAEKQLKEVAEWQEEEEHQEGCKEGCTLEGEKGDTEENAGGDREQDMGGDTDQNMGVDTEHDMGGDTEHVGEDTEEEWDTAEHKKGDVQRSKDLNQALDEHQSEGVVAVSGAPTLPEVKTSPADSSSSGESEDNETTVRTPESSTTSSDSSTESDSDSDSDMEGADERKILLDQNNLLSSLLEVGTQVETEGNDADTITAEQLCKEAPSVANATQEQPVPEATQVTEGTQKSTKDSWDSWETLSDVPFQELKAASSSWLRGDFRTVMSRLMKVYAGDMKGRKVRSFSWKENPKPEWWPQDLLYQPHNGKASLQKVFEAMCTRYG